MTFFAEARVRAARQSRVFIVVEVVVEDVAESVVFIGSGWSYIVFPREL